MTSDFQNVLTEWLLAFPLCGGRVGSAQEFMYLGGWRKKYSTAIPISLVAHGLVAGRQSLAWLTTGPASPRRKDA